MYMSILAMGPAQQVVIDFIHQLVALARYDFFWGPGGLLPICRERVALGKWKTFL